MEDNKPTLILGLLAHVDAGKTTLTEGLLYTGGMLKAMGRVDKQNAFLDTEDLEKQRGITIFSKQAVIHDQQGDIILMDTPGHLDFSSEMERTLGILDTALLIISGSEGIESHTRTLWRLLAAYNIPTVIFVNKMDQNTAERGEILASLRESFGDGAIDFSSFEKDEPGFYEELATCSEKLLEEYLSEDRISPDSICEGIRKRTIFPVFFGSALKNDGIRELYSGIKTLLLKGNNLVLKENNLVLKENDLVLRESHLLLRENNSSLVKDDPGTLSGLVYKIGHDSQGTRLTYVKITNGFASIRDTVTYNTNKPTADREAGSEISEKITGIRLYSGSSFDQLQRAGAGMVVALTGLSATYAGQGLGLEKDLRPPSLVPALSYKMILPEGTDPLSVLPMLRTLSQEDPQLHLTWDGARKEISLGLMGEIQTQVIKGIIKSRFGLDVEFSPGSIIYKETIDTVVEGVGHFEPLRHYAEVHLLMEPGERGSGLVIDNDCNTDLLSLNYQRLILTHLSEREHKGVLTGSVITDIKITLKSGKAHLKHTEGGDFRQATYRAVRQGLMQARSILLEPYYEFTLTVPENYIGRSMTDLDNLKSTFVPAKISDGFAVITGKGPVSCLQSYGRSVMEYTRGLGTLEMTVCGYDICHNTQEVLLEKNYQPEEDLRNPSYSVFCTHGAGFPVAWYEVPEYMHLPSVLDPVRAGAAWDQMGVSHTGSGPYTSDSEAFGTGTPEDDNLYYGNEVLMVEREKHFIREEDRYIDPQEVDRIISSASSANTKAGGLSRKGIPQKSRLNKRTYGAGNFGGPKPEYSTSGSGPTSGKPVQNPEKNLQGTGKSQQGSGKARETPKKPEYLLVDGYNIIFAWPELENISRDNVDGARGRLLDIMSNYQGVRACEIIVVFDAYRLKNHPEEVIKFNNICVVYTREAETADAYIEKFAHKNSAKYDITVATSDGLEQIIIRGAGAKLLSAGDLKQEVDRITREAVTAYRDKEKTSGRKIFLGESMPEDIELL